MYHLAAFSLIALPWLNPFAPGPSPAVVPLLFSWACAASLSGIYRLTPDLTSNNRLVTVAATAWLAAGNAASSSRTGLVQLLLLCALCWWWGSVRPVHHRRVWMVLAMAVVMYGLATVLLPWLAGFDLSLHGLAARLRTGDDACSSRLTLWSNVLHLIAQKPWLGWGWGELDYAHYVTAYNGPRFCDILDNAHNLPLHLAVELGVPLAVLLCGGAAWWVLRRRPWADANPGRQLAWSVLAIILLHSLLEYPLWYGPFQMAAVLCVVMLWRRQPAAVSTSPENAEQKRLLRQPAYGFIAIIMISMCGYAAWDYDRISQLYLSPESRNPGYRSDTLAKVRGSWLFANQVQFAELMVTPLEPKNAVWTFEAAGELLHYSPEPRVIEKRIEAAVMLGRDDDALEHLAHYRTAFPAEHARWAKANGRSSS